MNDLSSVTLAPATTAVPSPSTTASRILSVAEALQALFVEEMGQTLQIKALPYPLMAGVAAAMEGLAHLNGKEPLLTRYSLGALAFDMTLDLTRAKELLGYAPTITMPEAFRRTAQWIKSHG